MAMTHDIEEEKKQNSCSATVLKPREGQGLWIINRRHRNYTEGAWNVKKFRKNEHELRLSKGFATGKYDEEIKFNAAIFYRIPLKYPLDEKKKSAPFHPGFNNNNNNTFSYYYRYYIFDNKLIYQ